MKIVERKNLDEQKWTFWCENAPESQPFLDLAYLDSVAINLLFVLNLDETGGMPLPYFEKFGIKTLYMPVFCRWIDWIGENPPDKRELLLKLQSIFKQADIYFRNEQLAFPSEDLVYQKVSLDEFKLNSMAKRKLKLLDKENCIISQENNLEGSLKIIRGELSNRFKTLKDVNFDSLEVLTNKLLNNNSLVIFNLHRNEQLLGALILIETDDRLLYLKGACEPEMRAKGGMYALLNHAIALAFESNRNFDFGGSRIPGVRQFNQCFGGQDQVYFRYQWSEGPAWYNVLKAIRNKWRRK